MNPKKSKPKPATVRKKRGKSKFQLETKVAAIEVGLARRENFFDVVDAVIRDAAKERRRLRDRRLIAKKTRDGSTDTAAEIEILLPAITTWLANATGSNGSPPTIPELGAACRVDLGLSMLFVECCIAEAAQSLQTDWLRRDQALVDVHDSATRRAGAAKAALRDQKTGKVAHDARGVSYKEALLQDSSRRQLVEGMTPTAIQHSAVRLGLESGVQIVDAGGPRPSEATIRAVAARLRDSSPFPTKDIRVLLRRVGTGLANATGHAGAEPEVPEVVTMWRLDPVRFMQLVKDGLSAVV